MWLLVSVALAVKVQKTEERVAQAGRVAREQSPFMVEREGVS
jgi:hypothetical protein